MHSHFQILRIFVYDAQGYKCFRENKQLDTIVSYFMSFSVIYFHYNTMCLLCLSQNVMLADLKMLYMFNAHSVKQTISTYINIRNALFQSPLRWGHNRKLQCLTSVDESGEQYVKVEETHVISRQTDFFVVRVLSCINEWCTCR